MCKQVSSTVDIVIDSNSISITDPKVEENVVKEPSPPSLLTRINAGYFTLCLSLASQALLWNTLIQHVNSSPAILNLFRIHTLPSFAFLLLWWLSACTLLLLSSLYLLRCIFHFHLVKSVFSHQIGVNFFFIPWISWLLLLQVTPFLHTNNFPVQILSWIFIVPVLILDIKTYGQWFTTEKRFLSLMANPASQLSMMGNFVASRAAARMGWNESAICIFTLGLVHYLVVFITLYQRLSAAQRFPAMLRPVFFLFVATPCAASLAWSSISGSFGMPCKLLYFLALFLFSSLICRPKLFKKSMKRFSLAWWAYSFPLTFLGLASVEYAEQVKGEFASALMLLLSVLSVVVFLVMMVVTAVNSDTLLQENDPCFCFDKDSHITYR